MLLHAQFLRLTVLHTLAQDAKGLRSQHLLRRGPLITLSAQPFPRYKIKLLPKEKFALNRIQFAVRRQCARHLVQALADLANPSQGLYGSLCANRTGPITEPQRPAAR